MKKTSLLKSGELKTSKCIKVNPNALKANKRSKKPFLPFDNAREW